MAQELSDASLSPDTLLKNLVYWATMVQEDNRPGLSTKLFDKEIARL
jgi:hypothetical protein